MLLACTMNMVKDYSATSFTAPVVEHGVSLPATRLIWPRQKTNGLDYRYHEQLCDVMFGQRDGGLKIQTLFLRGEIGFRLLELNPAALSVDQEPLLQLQAGKLIAADVDVDGMTIPALQGLLRKRYALLQNFSNDCGHTASTMLGLVVDPGIPYETLRLVLLNAMHSGFDSFAFVVSSESTTPWTYSKGEQHAKIELRKGQMLGVTKRRRLVTEQELVVVDEQDLQAWGVGCATVSTSATSDSGVLMSFFSDLARLGAVPIISGVQLETDTGASSALGIKEERLSLRSELSVLFASARFGTIKGINGQSLFGECAGQRVMQELSHQEYEAQHAPKGFLDGLRSPIGMDVGNLSDPTEP